MDIQEFKQVLSDAGSEIKNLSKTRHLNKVGEAFVNGQLNVIELLLIAIHNGETSMDKIKSSLVTSVVRLEDIQVRQRTSELESIIKEVVEQLEPGTAGVVNVKTVSYGNLNNKISRMRRQKKIPDNVSVSKRGNEVYLVKR